MVIVALYRSIANNNKNHKVIIIVSKCGIINYAVGLYYLL